jgi:lysophospholipid acyltransferase (LPLAT)-like uncharacterized protein
MSITASGSNLGFTPDGPRGPFQQAASGAAFVAAKTGYPLLPITFSATRHKRLRSWDRFMIPLLFSRIVFVADDPIWAEDASSSGVTQTTHRLTTSLNRITAEADAICGIAP